MGRNLPPNNNRNILIRHLCMHALHNKLTLIYSLKRTTDVMFGGKQVVVCGYGEVEWIFLRFIHDSLSLHEETCNLFMHMKCIVFL